MTTIAFSTPKRWTLLSWAIKKFTKSRVSHCLIGTEIMGHQIFLHCTAGGVKIDSRKGYLKDNDLIHEFKFKGGMTEAVRHAWSHIDDDYDYAGIFGFAWVIIWGWLKRKVKNPVASPSSMWCSEFVLHLNAHGEHAGIVPEWNGLDPEYTHCQHLIDRIKPGEGSFGEDLAK